MRAHRSRCRTTRGAFARRAYAILTVCMVIAACSITTSPGQSDPFVAAEVAASTDCVPSDGGVVAVTNWGAHPSGADSACPDDGTSGNQLANWGRSLNRTTAGSGGVTNAKSNQVGEQVGQAAGEVGVQAPPTPVVCSRGNCAAETPVVCSRAACGVQTPVVCSRAACGVQTPVVCSRGSCTTPTASASATATSETEPPPLVLGPEWQAVLQWRQDILTAQQQVIDDFTARGLEQVLVPLNVVMAEMMIETGGVMPDNPNQDGAVGLLQVTGMTIGADRYDLVRANTEPAYSIYVGVYELALRYLDSGKLPWRNVIVGYFSGHYYPNGAQDAYNSDYNYQAMFDKYFAVLEAASAQAGGKGASTARAAIPGNWLAGQGQTIAGLAYLWGNIDAPLTQEFGPTDFSAGNSIYSYSTEYGFAEWGHTGLDVGVVMGTPLYAPTDAIVICAGTDNGTGEDSCAAFASAAVTATSGRLQLKLPSGDMLIYGHVLDCVVTPGQHVRAGELLGHSGTQNGDHVHMEYRVLDPTTGSGWRIIDPRLTPLNGIPVQVSPGSAGPAPTPGPTLEPTQEPTAEPTEEISVPPTVTRTAEPPTATPETVIPTDTPTETPVPTETPTETPVPTETPTETPTPTEIPAEQVDPTAES